MYLVASVRPSVRESVCLSSSLYLCVWNQWAYADNCADAVDRLYILNIEGHRQAIHGDNPLQPVRFCKSALFPRP